MILNTEKDEERRIKIQLFTERFKYKKYKNYNKNFQKHKIKIV